MNLKLAWRNLWRNKRRTLITLASITFAVFFSCIMLSMQLGSYERMIDNAVRFHTGYAQIHAGNHWDEKTLENSLAYTDSLNEAVLAVEHVEEVVPRLESFALASHGEKTKAGMVIGMDPGKEDKLTGVKSKLVKGAYLEAGDQEALVSEGLADYLQLGVGDTLVMISQGYRGVNAAGKYAVKGIVKIPSPELNNQLIYLPLQEAQWFFGAEGRLTAMALIIDDADHVDQVVKRLNQRLPEGFEVMGWREMMPGLVQSIELDHVSGVIMMYILYVVIGFGIFGAFLMMTTERRYEFGILLSIGMKRLRLQGILVLEVIIMGLLGVLGGVLLSLPLIVYLHANPILMSGEYTKIYEQFGMEPIMPFSIDPVIFYRQGIIVLIMSVIIGLYPVYTIFRLDPATAMRK